MGADLFHADGQTDMTKLIVAFLNFANALKYQYLHHRKHTVGLFPLKASVRQSCLRKS